jgi:trigger factor
MRTVEEDREVRNKDWLDIDLEGFLNNESRKDLTAKAYVCQVGDKKMLLDDLSSGIIGSKVGEEREVKAVYPSDYHIEDLKGKEITFKIKINKILDKITPELTDEIVKGEAKSKEEFINSIKENLEYNKKYARDNDIKTQIINALLEKNSFDVPSAEVERRLPEIRERMLRNMFGPNASKLPEANIKEILSKYADDMKKIAEREVKLSYIMNAIAKVEDINVTSEEVKQELEDMAKSMNTTATKLKAKYGEANIYSGLELTIIERKTFDYLIKEANISKKE